jgi:hypothetical protein
MKEQLIIEATWVAIAPTPSDLRLTKCACGFHPRTVVPGRLPDQKEWAVWCAQCGRRSDEAPTAEGAIENWKGGRQTEPTVDEFRCR